MWCGKLRTAYRDAYREQEPRSYYYGHCEENRLGKEGYS